MLYMDLEYCKGVLFVRLDGKLTRKNTYRINNYLTPVLVKHRIKYLVYNLFSISEMDDYGVDAILRTKHAVKGNHGYVCLCEVPEQFQKQLKRLRVSVTESELTALEKLKV